MGKCDLIVGLQYGSEGKGKIAAMLAPLYKGAVRVGAPNAGHTVIYKDKPYKMRQIPCAWVNPDCELFIGAAGLVSKEVMLDELGMLPVDVPIMSRLMIDRNAGVLILADKTHEEGTGMNLFNGSTAEGVGPALARKLERRGGTIVKDDPFFKAQAGRVAQRLYAILDHGDRIMIEGTQGYGLSLNHGPYPFCTSRDVLASSLLSDVGLAPADCGEVYGVMRTYPIRVAGNSGPMGAKELTWPEVAQRAGYQSLEERTTVTKRIRRVSELDWDLLQEAVRANRPTGLFVMFADYIDAKLARLGMKDMSTLYGDHKVEEFVTETEKRLGVEVLALSTGPKSEHMIWLNEDLEDKLKEATNVGRCG